MVGEHRASFLVSVAALCGRRPRLARLARAGNGISVGYRVRGEVVSWTCIPDAVVMPSSSGAA
jgi:hypothetical protein